VTISYEGYIKRQPLSSFRKQGRGGKGVIGATTKETDFVKDIYIASTHSYLLMFTNTGRCYWLKVYDLPQVGRVSMGRSIANLLELRTGERVTSLLPVRDFDDRFVMMVTKSGIVKKTELKAYSRPNRAGIIALTLDEGDSLISAYLTSGKDEVVIATRDGMAIRFEETDARPMGRTARGVSGIKLRPGDAVIGMVPRRENGVLLTVCEYGYGKCTPFDMYRLTRRSGYGVINIDTKKRNGKVVGILAVYSSEDLLVVTSHGKIIRCSIGGIPTIGRATQGVRIIDVKEGDTVANICRSDPSPEAIEEVEGGDPRTAEAVTPVVEMSNEPSGDEPEDGLDEPLDDEPLEEDQ
jgi:DNA gyrase subunit A